MTKWELSEVGAKDGTRFLFWNDETMYYGEIANGKMFAVVAYPEPDATTHLLSSPENAKRLMRSISQFDEDAKAKAAELDDTINTIMDVEFAILDGVNVSDSVSMDED